MNRDFKKFVRKILYFASFFIVTLLLQFLLGMFIIGSQYQEEYNASLLDKVARLKSIKEPKIILTGNSNLAFGINSSLIQNAFNMPVVNLGLHGGLGNAFHENVAKLNINSGDIVIICHSNFADDDSIGDISLAWITVEYHKGLWEIIREKDYCDMLKGYPKYWIKSFFRWLTFQGNKTPKPPYSRRAFNEYGDVIFRPEDSMTTEKFFKPKSIKVPKINDICITRLNKLNRYIKEKGASLLIAGYPIGYGKYTPASEEYEKFQNELAEKLDCEIISDYKNYFIPYKYFYNATLHLNEQGTEIRTNQLINDIKNWIFSKNQR